MSMSAEFNIFEKSTTDNSIVKSQYRPYYPYINASRNREDMDITEHQSDGWVELQGSFVIVEGKLNVIGSGSMQVLNNAGVFFFYSGVLGFYSGFSKRIDMIIEWMIPLCSIAWTSWRLQRFIYKDMISSFPKKSQYKWAISMYILYPNSHIHSSLYLFLKNKFFNTCLLRKQVYTSKNRVFRWNCLENYLTLPFILKNKLSSGSKIGL